MKETIEDMVKVSSKGQIVIPKQLRERLRVKAGERLVVLSRDREILLRKIEDVSIEEVAEKIEKQIKQKCIDPDILVDEAIQWARKSK